MKKDKDDSITGSTYEWEVSEIDLQLKHYMGSSTDVIKKIKLDIEKYLKSSDNIPQKTREIYSAIYCALDYYRVSTHLPTAEFYKSSVLANFFKTLTSDFNQLSSTFKSENPEDIPVIDISARIKSPASFVKKVKEKIDEYLQEDRDLSYFNESLRDLMGARIIVTPPIDVQKQGLQAESDYLYQVVYSFMENHGIHRKSVKRAGDFKFIPINTRHNQSKLDSIKSRPKTFGFADAIQNGKVKLFIPDSRIPEIEEPEIDGVVKDYNKWPKYSGYQSIHICVIPDYTDLANPKNLPPYIIPQKSNNIYIEYQFRTQKQHEFAEHGLASHKGYKPLEDDEKFHRLRVPLYISYDRENNNFRVLNFAESYEITSGHSFKDKFNIDFDEFIDRFTTQERNEVLAGRKVVKYDKDNIPYLEDNKALIIESQDELSQIVQIKSNQDGQVAEFFEKHGALDSSIEVISDDTDDPDTRDLQMAVKPRQFEIITFKAAEARKLDKSAKATIEGVVNEHTHQAEQNSGTAPKTQATDTDISNPYDDSTDGPEF